MRLFALLLLSLLLAAPARAACPQAPLPAEIALVDVGTGQYFHVSHGGGSVFRNFLHGVQGFDFKNGDGQTVAIAHRYEWPWGTEIRVDDCAGGKIASVRELVFHKLFSVWNQYEVQDAEGKLLATSTQVSIGAPRITLTRPDGKLIAVLQRGAILKNWSVRIEDGTALDASVLLMIAAYQSYADSL
jgi:hypothetical protein